MIYIVMNGRLGNQFFQYAFARRLKENNPDETIVYNFDKLYRGTHDDSGHENSLRFLKTDGTERNDEVNYSVLQYGIRKCYRRFYPHGGSFLERDRYERKWIRFLAFFGMYFLNLGYYSFKLKKPWWVKNLIVDGSFECERYFQGVEDELKSAFVPKQPLHDYNQELMDVIKITNSVAISVRRGDFVNKRHIGTYYVCDESYYEKAITLIRQKVKNPVFIFFSNDIEWVKENIKVDDCQCYYESGRDEVWETFRLMSSCKHFIISNSTLHWWAQYMSTNPDKVVVAPSRWYNSDFKSALYQDNWLLIDV